ncbi:hypothetical protein DFJ74DRAFT_672886 [Hyaloraphidium curvatum]|nr:hypothetical protein DFJ74DRAFT_672886 [Hyaloraphidium curvatum]
MLQALFQGGWTSTGDGFDPSDLPRFWDIRSVGESPHSRRDAMSATTTTVPSEVINKPIVDALAAKSFEVSKLFGVHGKWAVVTGGRVGIGLMIAAGLVQNGANVIITARDEKKLAEAAEILNKAGPGKAYAVAADLAPLDGVEKLVAETRKLTDKVHILCNNAGIDWDRDTIETFPDKAFQDVVHLNLTRCFTVTQKMLPLLAAAGTPDDPGRVIMIASVDGQRTPVEYENYAYVSAKAGLIQLSKNLAGRLYSSNVTCNAIGPGPFLSEMMADFLNSAPDWGKTQPFLRIGTPEDMAGAVLFLSSRAGSFVSGALINVDGALLSSQGFVNLRKKKSVYAAASEKL